MYCHTCVAEYREGIAACPECGRPLEADPPSPPEPPVPVFETGDTALVPVIQSVLQSARIPFLMQGGGAAALLPVGPGGGIFSDHGVGVIFLVPAARAEEAKALLDELPEELPAPPAGENAAGESEDGGE